MSRRENAEELVELAGRELSQKERPGQDTTENFPVAGDCRRGREDTRWAIDVSLRGPQEP